MIDSDDMLYAEATRMKPAQLHALFAQGGAEEEIRERLEENFRHHGREAELEAMREGVAESFARGVERIASDLAKMAAFWTQEVASGEVAPSREADRPTVLTDTPNLDEFRGPANPDVLNIDPSALRRRALDGAVERQIAAQRAAREADEERTRRRRSGGNDYELGRGSEPSQGL